MAYGSKPIKRMAKKARVRSPDEDDGLQWSWSWRSLSAVVYLLICLTDFLFMPVYREYTYTKMTVPQMVRLAMEMDDGAAQIEALKVLKEDRAWVPITNDMFHLSFGAILGVAALPMARDRYRRRRRYGNDYDDDYGNDYGSDRDHHHDDEGFDYASQNDGDYGGAEPEGDFGPNLPKPSGRM